MGRGLQGAVLKGLGAKDHVLTVKAKAAIGPHLVRITFAAPPSLATAPIFPQPGFADGSPIQRGHQHNSSAATPRSLRYTPCRSARRDAR